MSLICKIDSSLVHQIITRADHKHELLFIEPCTAIKYPGLDLLVFFSMVLESIFKADEYAHNILQEQLFMQGVPIY